MDTELKNKLDQIIDLLKGIREDQNKTFKLLNKYDDSYLAEVERHGSEFIKEG